jgi:hypothetical protein
MCLTSCKKIFGGSDDNEKQQQEDNKITWDFFLVGSWKYGEVADEGKELSTFPAGVENFLGSGDYICYSQTEKGDKAIIKGTWKLDDKDKYGFWVYLTEVKLANGNSKKLNNKMKYTMLSLNPRKMMTYRVGDCTRKAQWSE